MALFSASITVPLMVTCSRFTVTSQEAVLVGSSLEAAVIQVVPGAIPVITPFSSTVATEVSALDQVTSRLVAVQGWTLAITLAVVPLMISTALLFRETALTLSVGSAQLSVLPVSSGIIRQLISCQKSLYRVNSPVAGSIS